MVQDLLLEIGVEELPATFVAGALDALPELVTRELAALRLTHGAVRVLGTPRRLAVIVEGLTDRQPDLDEEVQGPPVRIAFDAAGAPTRAAESFAAKVGVPVSALGRVATPKGEVLAARRTAPGERTLALLPAPLGRVAAGIPFRKSMRWGEGDTAFGRPVRWLLARFGAELVPFEFAGLRSAGVSHGHRFRAPDAFEVAGAATYVDALRARHVVVDPAERAALMEQRLQAAARELGGALIEDPFLVGENLSLVEIPEVVAGAFAPEFLELPDQVILDVARGHQRYFGVRDPSGRLMPRYLAVVNTALRADAVRRGNDRVMRARLSDAKFFWETDLATPLGERRARLGGVMFHKRLGSVADKVDRLVAVLPALGALVGAPAALTEVAVQGAALAKCDLVSLMVGEFPELQGEMGRAYALRQGLEPAVAEVIASHYLPRGADDATPGDAAGALLGLADRLDTLAGCFAIGVVPTGSADPLALRRAALGVLRIALDQRWPLSLAAAIRVAHGSFHGVALDLGVEPVVERLGAFLRDRLRGLLAEALPPDVVDACLAADADHPTDARARAWALASIEPGARASAGEVFKRAANIARDATPGEPVDPASLGGAVEPAEVALVEAFRALTGALEAAREAGDHAAALHAVGGFAPHLERFFKEVFVMVEDLAVRQNRLRWMAEIERECSRLARFNLLAPAPARA